MFKGLGQLGDMAGIMKQAQEMQESIKRAQEEVEAIVAEGEAGGGLVRVTANGKGKVTGLNIDPSILREDSKEAVEDLIMAALNDAQSKAADKAAARMQEATGNMPIPDSLKGMF